MVSPALAKPPQRASASSRRPDEAAIDPARAQALRDEVAQLNEHSRHIFTVFAVWWAFSVTINLAGVTLVAAFGYLHSFPAMVGAFLNFCGSVFCMMVAVRLLMIHDRASKVLHELYGSPDEPAPGPNLNDPPTPAELVRGVFDNLKPPRLGAPRTPWSAVPIGFYVTCIVPAMLINSPSFGVMWLAAHYTMPASKIEMLEQERAAAAPSPLHHEGAPAIRVQVAPAESASAPGAES